MLARIGRPFDSDEHLFEIKWDGIRALAFVEGGDCRLVSRRRNDLTERYPECDVLAKLPPGCVLDGELVVLKDGRDDFESVLSREQARDPHRVRMLARALPISYVVFDVLYEGFEPVMKEPLEARRERLRALLASLSSPHVVFSDGVVGAGEAFFAAATLQGHEGVVAKRLDGRYQPGARPDTWRKTDESC